MGFLWTTITVNNLEESLKFYQEVVGLTLNNKFVAWPTTEIAFLGDGETKIELICHGQKKVDIGQDISLGFKVESVDRHMAELKEKGINIVAGPVQPNPHTKFFFVLDPNGVKIQFVELM